MTSPSTPSSTRPATSSPGPNERSEAASGAPRRADGAPPIDRRREVRSVICQVCDVEAPTRNVTFHETIGGVVVRQTRSVKGNLCKACIGHYFREYTQNTALFGWWG